MGDDYTNLLARINAGEPPGTVFREMLAQWSQANPSLAVLARYLEVRDARAREAAELEAPEQPEPQAPTNDALEAELAELRINNDRLAAALGACYLCWGRRRECPNCDGRGSPGWAPPDRALFSELIRPAIVRYSASRGAGHHPSNGNGTEQRVN